MSTFVLSLAFSCLTVYNTSFEITQQAVPAGSCYEVVPNADG